MQTVVKAAKIVWAQDNKLTEDAFKAQLDLSDDEYELKVDTNDCIQLKGKFNNMDLKDKSIKVPGQYEVTGTDTLSVKVNVDGKEEKCKISTGSTGTGSTGN